MGKKSKALLALKVQAEKRGEIVSPIVFLTELESLQPASSN